MSSNLCSYFQTPKGCSRGDQCKFLHEKSDKIVKLPYPCVYWFGLNGNKSKSCKNKNCAFSHEDSSCKKVLCPEKEKCTNKECLFNHEDIEEPNVKAAGILLYKIIDDRKLFYLILHNEEEEIFAEPGGKREEGETTMQTAKREFKEETGVNCPFTFISESCYIPSSKYKLFTHRVSDIFELPESKGRFVPLDGLKLHVRTENIIRNL